MLKISWDPQIFTLIFVPGSVQSSNLMEYPTSAPKIQPRSSATRLAREVAATLRGSVIPTIFPSAPHPASTKYWKKCVSDLNLCNKNNFQWKCKKKSFSTIFFQLTSQSREFFEPLKKKMNHSLRIKNASSSPVIIFGIDSKNIDIAIDKKRSC